MFLRRFKYFYKQFCIFFIRIALRKQKLNIYFKNSIIIVPHPDDEILGLGGIILQTLQLGGKVHFIYLTDGGGSGVWPDQEEIKRQRMALSEKVHAKLGLKNSDITRLHLPDGAVPFPKQAGFEDVVQEIKLLIDTLKPEVVFTTHMLEYWPYDHIACAHIGREAVNQSTYKPQLYYYWVWTWYNLRLWQLFQLNYKNIYLADIHEQFTKKMRLMDLYLNTLTPDGKPWSGVLPKSLIKAFGYPIEILERVDIDIQT